MPKFAFFGTDEFAVAVLAGLKKANFIPDLIVTTPDKPKGRKLLLTPSPAKVWAQGNKIKLGQPEAGYDLFVVASYGKIIKKTILDLPKHGTLNIHPSLLPLYRGPTPIQSAILNDDEITGVSIILLDEQVDHGAILAQEKVEINNKNYPELRDELAKIGADLLAKVLPDYLTGEIEARPQDHSLATFTKKINRADGEIKLGAENSEINYRKFLAYQPWPGIFFFDKNNKRIKITNAVLENNLFVIKKVVPEGRPEMRWEDWERGANQGAGGIS